MHTAPPIDIAAERVRLVTLMAAMAEGDQGAVFALVAELGHHLAGTVKAQLRGYGRHDLLRDQDEVEGLVLTAAFEILDRAGSWDPDGAPPWVWARNAIHAAIVREIGHPSVELDDQLDGEGPGPVAGNGSALDPTAGLELDPFDPRDATDARLRLLGEAIDRFASDRDRRVVRQFLLQKAYGDPSPSHTVAHDLGLSPENVRQIVSRVRRRLRELPADDDRYRLLGESGWLAA
ncbi:MAG: hypothetical protein ACXWCM_03090 [Acidimicrobiales bacterium]